MRIMFLRILREVARRGVAAAVAASAVAPVHAQSPGQVGAWEPPFPLPLIAIHSALLPTGKVLLFSAEHGVPGIHGWLLDPTTLALKNVDPPAQWNPDCAGHSFLRDGRLLVAGGTLSFTPLTGSKLAFIFDPWSEQWVQIEDMDGGRWYPTNITVANGRVITMAGLSDVPGTNNPDIEMWDSMSSSNWTLLGQKALPYYPLLHLMPSGLVFMAGPSALTETYNPATNSWAAVDTTNFPGRYEACSVLLPPTLTRVMLIGGYNGSMSGQPTNSAEIIDLANPSPQWSTTAHMAFPRMEHNAVILPNGKVLVVGGRSDNDATPTPVLTPELFDPATSTWSTVAPHAIPRRYHSTSILLPDGRVLAAGGDFQPTGEIYSPAYLFNGPRPTIGSSPAAIAYGTSFPIEFTGTTSTHSAVLVSLSAVTHSNNMTQRCVSLGAIPSSGGNALLMAPANGAAAPPGYYMLFVVSSAGVPSVAKMVRVGAVAPYGSGTPGCAGLQALSAASPATIGGDFVLTCAGAPQSASGLVLIADQQDLSGTDPLGISLILHVGLASTVFLGFDMPSDPSGVGSTLLPIPNTPAVAGATFFAQALWFWGTNCPALQFGLSSSNGLSFVIQP